MLQNATSKPDRLIAIRPGSREYDLAPRFFGKLREPPRKSVNPSDAAQCTRKLQVHPLPFVLSETESEVGPPDFWWMR